jgi:hypothetical protein
MKTILTEIVNRLADTAASLDALEIELVERCLLKRTAIHNRFHIHKQIVDSQLLLLRRAIAGLEE